MSLFVYVTDEIREDVVSMGIGLSKLAQFVDDVETKQSTSCFDRFPPPFLTKKKIWSFNNRLIAAEQRIGEHLCVLLLRLVVKGHEYTDFENDPETVGTRYLSRVDISAVGNWLSERTRKNPPVLPPQPSEAEQAFLWAASDESAAEDTLIYETANWVQSVAEERVKSRLVLIPAAIMGILERGAPRGFFSVPNEEQLKIHYRLSEDRRKLLLTAARFSGTGSPDKDEYASVADRISDDDFGRVSVRSYPSLICYDQDMWLQVQKDFGANLALSPEEAEILAASRRLSEPKSGFPLFINGRAGSGKSTILQWLFADYYVNWFRNLRPSAGASSRPLYLASSSDLIQVAERVVRGLLTANHSMLLTHLSDVSNKTEPLNLLGNSFRSYHQYLESLVSPTDRASRFNGSNYVNYARFRRMWAERFGREPTAVREFGPQVSWHVIRTYVKGLSVDSEMEGDEYEDMPREERSVSKDRFEKVFKRVWSGWYRDLCTREGLWDDQDLARFVLGNESQQQIVRPQNSAVFCDEAQDFTRLEIEVLYRLCLFSERSLKPEEVRRVPFAFAGDPFQTLHPTGFRWEAVKAGFTERILLSLRRFETRREVPELNYRELTFNYRSTANIVRLCNTIQAARAVAFGLTTLRPQNCWRIEEASPMPVLFSEADPRLKETIRQQADLVIIVPCEENEEADFVGKSEFLRSVVTIDEDGIPQNVLSPARAKGLEFNRVLLYGFGQRDEAGLLLDRLDHDGPPRTSAPEQTLPLEYFMNSLYVAASRARRRLFVVDSPKALQGWWRFTTDENLLLRVIHHLPRNGEDWKPQVGQLVQGVWENWTDDRDDPRQIAIRFEEEGRRNEDPYLLRQAAIQYRNHGSGAKADECRAWAAWFEKDYVESGRRFDAAGIPERALDAFWLGGHQKEIMELVGRRGQLVNALEARVASFLTAGKPTAEGAGRLLGQILDRTKTQPEFKVTLTTTSWRSALTHVLQLTANFPSNSATREQWLAITLQVDGLIQLGIVGEPETWAQLLLRSGRLEEAAKAIEHDPKSHVFREAFGRLSTDRYSSAKDTAPPDAARAAAELEWRGGAFRAAGEWFAISGDLDRVEDCVLELVRHSDSPDPEVAAALQSLVRCAMRKDKYLYALEVARRGRIDRARKVDRQRLEAITTGAQLVLRGFVPELARSEEVVKEPKNVLNSLTEVLRELLITADPAAWDRWKSQVTLESAGAAIGVWPSYLANDVIIPGGSFVIGGRYGQGSPQTAVDGAMAAFPRRGAAGRGRSTGWAMDCRQ